MERLKNACSMALADPSLKPGGGKTYCNFGARKIAEAMLCAEFDTNSTADTMHATMALNVSGKWRKCTGAEATIHALDDRLAFAALPSSVLGETHGHIAAIYPLGMQLSGSLGRDVPFICNIGKSTGIMKVSEAFPVKKGEPDYFLYLG